MTRKLGFMGPYAVQPALSALAAHAVPGLEVCEPAARRHTRLVPSPNGSAAVTVEFSAGHVLATMELPDAASEAPVVAAVRSWLDLDADLAEVEEVLRRDSTLTPLIAQRPGLRVLGSVDGFETAVLTVVGQQVSLAAGRTFAGRLVAAFGESHGNGSALTRFPTAERLAATDPSELQRAVGLTGARTRTLLVLAQACADGLVISTGGDRAETRRTLLALPGIGPWTVDYLAVRALGDRDACPADDLVLRRALGVRTGREALARAEGWRPWRAYGVTHLWTQSAYLG